MLSIALIPSATRGAPTGLVRREDGREFYLHSRFNPIEEAAFLVQDLTPQERTLYVVLGFGLGYHVRELLRRSPASSHVVVLEPDDARLSAPALEDPNSPAKTWIGDPRLHFLSHHDPQLTPVHLADRLAALRLLSIKMFTHVPSATTAEEFYRVLATEIPRTFPANVQRHLNALDHTLENDLNNVWANLSSSWNAAPIDRLRGRWTGKPVVIVSGGPSLSDALPMLADAGQKALILATGSTARLLRERGIRPDLVISVDPYVQNAAHFQGWDTSDVPLVYYHRVNHGVLSACAGPRCVFLMQDEPPLPLTEPPERPGFSRGGTVAFSALQLAHALDANPIVFVGQDFAFAGGRTHSEGALYSESFDELSPPDDFIQLRGVDGQPVVSSRLLHSYLLHMQDYLLNFSRQRPDVRHINVSRIGALVRGMTYETLERALADAPNVTAGDRQALAAALTPLRTSALAIRRATVSAWREELGRVIGGFNAMNEFDGLFASFKATSLYEHAGRSYDDLYWLFETMYQRGKNPQSRAFVDRFKQHLRAIDGHLGRMSGES